MRWTHLREACQRGLAVATAPNLHRRWKRYVQLNPELNKQYMGGPPAAQRHWRTYLCRSWGTRRRLATLLEHYTQLESLPGDWRKRLLALQPVSLCQVPLKGGDALELLLEPSDFFREGDLGLYLRDSSGERMYSLNFSFGGEGKLFISGLQGPRTTVKEGMVGWLGKEMFGLRPKNLLLTSLYTLSEQLGGRQLLGISDASHPRARKLKSSYDAFWLEAQACRHDRHWFRLPEREPVRDIAEVKSQRRSEFRRREALREEVAAAIRKAWEQSAAGV